MSHEARGNKLEDNAASPLADRPELLVAALGAYPLLERDFVLGFHSLNLSFVPGASASGGKCLLSACRLCWARSRHLRPLAAWPKLRLLQLPKLVAQLRYLVAHLDEHGRQ